MPKKIENKQPYVKKPLYSLPYKSSNNHYLIILKTVNILHNNKYIVKKIKNLYHYMSVNYDKCIVLYRYYEIKDFDYSCIKVFKENANIYTISDLNVFYDVIETKYNIVGYTPKINYEKNPFTTCHSHKFDPEGNEDMLHHLQTCDTYMFTLFNKPIPKEINKKKTPNVCVTINNNTQNNVYNNYISFRETGDFLRSKLTFEEKKKILCGIDKVGEMVKRHFDFEEIKNNIRLKNVSPYKSCQIYDGKTFVVKNNFEIFRYYIMDQLDALEMIATVDVQDENLIKRLDRYDHYIRKSHKNMLALVNQTILQVKEYTSNEK